MTTVVIAGAGGLGREIADSVEAAAAAGGPTLRGFLDDGAASGDWSHLGRCDPASVTDDDRLIIGVGDPVVRHRLAETMGTGIGYHTVIHPTAVVSPRAELGAGVFVAPFAYVGPGARIGDHAVLNIYAGVGHDAVVGRCAVLSPYATLNGHAEVGEGCFLGTGAIVTVAVTIGAWSKVGAGAVAMRDAPGGSLLIGTPAKGRTMFKPPGTPRQAP